MTMNRMKAQPRFVVCIRTNGSDDLERRKVYQVLPDRAAAREGYVRVVDESGEDYLYPTDYFVAVRLPAAVAQELGAPSNPPPLQRTASTRRRPGRVRLRAARG